MIKQNEKNESIERFISPENCPVCGQTSRGLISCKNCGLYFFRYYEKQNILDHEGFIFKYIYHSSSKIGHNINWLLFLVTVSVIAIMSFTNISVDEIHNQNKIRIPGTISKNTLADASRTKSVNIYQKNPKSSNESKTRLLSMDSMLALYNGKDSFNEAVLLFEQHSYFEAAEKFKQALTFLEKSKHYESIALTNLNIGVCYYNTKKYDDSLLYFENALYLSRENGFSKIETRAIQGKSLVFKKLEQKQLVANLL